MLIFWPISFYNGRGVYDTVLWRYYVLEFKRQMQSSDALGPTYGTTALVIVAVQHLTAAAVAGVLLVVVGRLWP